MMNQGMDTGMNPEMLMRLLQKQQLQQASSTGQMNERDIRRTSSAVPVNTPGTVSSWVPPPARFDQNAQPGLASIAPRNIPQAMDMNPQIPRGVPQPMEPPPPQASEGLRVGSPLQSMYKVPPSLAR